jgi:hypothetical protein
MALRFWGKDAFFSESCETHLLSTPPNQVLQPTAELGCLCELKDLICNLTLLGNFLNFGHSRLTIGRVCSQRLQTR